jgi:leucine dehydrogenase
VLAEDAAAGYQGIIAVHSTALGPAVGGTRLWRYANVEEALNDALRLARGMTYKNALAGLPFGGGKSVILATNEIADREKLFRAHGRAIESLRGSYITAEDVGTGPGDMEFIRKETNYVGGLAARSGDPSPHTARGVFRAMQAAAKHRWNTDSLAGKTVAIQGCGHVGECLARELHRAGARLVVSDVEQNRATKVAHDLHAQVVGPSEIYSSAADVFAPCALGAVLNDETIPRLSAEIVCGAANNQLLDARHGETLRERKILYVPDYAANAGGVVNGCCRELLGWTLQQTLEKIEAIYNTIRNILDVSTQEGITPDAAADRIAESRFAPDRETTDRKKSPTAILR